MARIFDVVSPKWMMAVLAIISLLVFSACGKSETPQVQEAKRQVAPMQPELERRMAFMAVESVVANLDSMLDLGGYQSLAGENGADKLVAMMNSAQAPDPGDPKYPNPKVPGPRFTYVANEASGPWQVVLKFEKEALRVTAYGSGGQPLEQRTVLLDRR